MSISNKVANEKIRAEWLTDLMDYVSDGETVLQIKSNEFCVPVVDCNGEEKYVVITVKVPTGADKGREPFDGYAEAEDYEHKLKEKAIKAQKKAEAKAKKIEHDEKMRAK